MTTAIYVGGAGACIIGGLYWKKGTTAGAWTALLAGSSLSVGGIVARQIYGDGFPMNGVQISFFSTLIAIVLYVLVSLLTCREDFDMDRLLHRGRYAAFLKNSKEAMPPPSHDKLSWGRLIGIDKNFTRGDKWIAGGLFAWSMIWFTIFLIGTVWNLISPWPDSAWSKYWHVTGISIPIFMSIATAIWFTWGGFHDIIKLFRRLKEQEVNHLDDGAVVDGHNRDERLVASEPLTDAMALEESRET